MSAQTQTRLSPEEYLAVERESETKHEYYDGHMYAMAGASFAHTAITGSFTSALIAALEGRRCTVHPTDLRIRISEKSMYTYPDIVVVCGNPELADAPDDTLLNPTLIVEVLSPSTERHDRGFKFAQYRKIPSVPEYVLVSQSEPRAESFRRLADGRWSLSEAEGLDAVLELDSIQSKIPLARIFAQVTFEPNIPLADAIEQR